MRRTYLAATTLALGFLLVFSAPAAAFSFGDLISGSQSLFTKISERVEMVLALTPAQKVTVLEKQAERRLMEAKSSAQTGNTVATTARVEDYKDLKTQQASILSNVAKNVVDEVKDKTINQQETLLDIVDLSPNSASTVSTVNKTVVENVKKTIEYKEGTTAGEDFGDKATIVYAPGTGPGGEGGGIKIEGGELHTWASGTSAGGGEAGVTYEGGAKQVWAPGTSGGGEGGVTYEGGKGLVVETLK